MRSIIAAVLALCAGAAAAQPVDPFQWLEGVESPASLAWVEGENAKSLPVLQGDARYGPLHDQALAILSAQDRIPTPVFEGNAVFNFWQDGEHVRGLWRRMPPEAYAAGSNQWETVLDLDALAKAEGANWIWKGAECQGPAYVRCMVELSDGGKDAIELREFDLSARAFVPGGFTLSQSKQTVAWLDDDTLILNRDWGPGTLTESGYGFVVKTLGRGQSLDQAVEVFRGHPMDVSVSPRVLKDGQGAKVVLIERATDFFHTEFHLVTPQGVKQLELPQRATVYGLLDGMLVFTIEEDWSHYARGQRYKAGSLMASPVEVLTSPLVLSNQDRLIFEPGPRQSIDEVAVTANRVVAVVYDNVRGKVVAFTNKGEWGWDQRELAGAPNAAVDIVSASDLDDRVFYSVESFIVPTELKLANAATGAGKTVRSLPARFDAKDLVVEQREAASKDGTAIPYFLVSRKGAALDGTAPTLLHAYGGFQLSKLPVYDPLVGKLWLERGGTYAVANIRGGGEFGPAWHEAALKANRQRAYDDFYAVAQDLIGRKVTSPRRLGIYGRSNGGLLMGVAMTQRPDLFNAVVVESPLLDMLRYHELPAGASWIGEYGDPRIAAEAAYIGAYSPYQALKPGVKYPLAYVTTNTKDDRVHPGHARKFAARLGQLGAPYLYYENTEGGHANAADPRAGARRWAMHYVYLTRQLMDK